MLAKRGLGWIMFQWVPYVENVPEGVVPILVCLYPYRCHMIMASVVNRIVYLVGMQVEHIPGECTGMCQPIDVGIGKPLKSKIRHKQVGSMDTGARKGLI
jgi:hypothetical protein